MKRALILLISSLFIFGVLQVFIPETSVYAANDEYEDCIASASVTECEFLKDPDPADPGDGPSFGGDGQNWGNNTYMHQQEYANYCGTVGIAWNKCQVQWLANELPAGLTPELVTTCRDGSKNEAGKSDIEAFVSCLVAGREVPETKLHPIVEGFLSGNEEIKAKEIEMHFAKYFLSYMMTPWHTDSGADIGKIIFDFFAVVLPSAISTIAHAISLIIALIVLYFYKFTSVSFLKETVGSLTQFVYNYLFVDSSIGVKLIIFVAILALFAIVIKVIGFIGLKKLLLIILQGTIFTTVFIFICLYASPMQDLATEKLEPTVALIFDKDPEVNSETRIREQIFEMLVQQPYILQNFGYGSLAEAIADDPDFVETRLEPILKGEDGATQKEISDFQNVVLAQDGGTAWTGAIVAVIGVPNSLMQGILVCLVLLPMLLINLILAVRPTLAIISVGKSLFKFELKKIVDYVISTIAWVLVGLIISEIVSIVLAGMIDMYVTIYGLGFFAALIINGLMILLVVLAFAFKEFWLPFAKAFGQSVMGVARSAMDMSMGFRGGMRMAYAGGRNSFSDAAKTAGDAWNERKASKAESKSDDENKGESTSSPESGHVNTSESARYSSQEGNTPSITNEQSLNDQAPIADEPQVPVGSSVIDTGPSEPERPVQTSEESRMSQQDESKSEPAQFTLNQDYIVNPGLDHVMQSNEQPVNDPMTGFSDAYKPDGEE